MTSAELHKGQLYCLWLLCLTGVFLCARALQRGHHLPDQRLGLHFRQCTVTDFHTQSGHWCCTDSTKRWAVTGIHATNLHHTVLLMDSERGIFTRDPSNATALLLPSIVKKRVTDFLQTSYLPNFRKANELSV